MCIVAQCDIPIKIAKPAVLFPALAEILFGTRGNSEARRPVSSVQHPVSSGVPDMTSDFDRRELIALAGLGGLGIVFGSAIATPAAAQNYRGPTAAVPGGFFFIHLSG